MLLREILPDQAARQIVGWVEAHLASLAGVLGDRPALTEAARVSLLNNVRKLAEFAQGSQLDPDVAEYWLEHLVPLLYGAPHPDVERGDVLDSRSKTELVHAADVALLAAHARCRLLRGLPVTVRQLAALGNSSQNYVRVAGSSRTIQIENGEIAANEALRWLQGR